MLICPACEAKNPNRMVYCGLCRTRLKPIPARLREDILGVVREQNRRFTGTVITVFFGLFSVLGFWGYSHLKQVLLERAEKEVIPRIADSADALIKSKVESAVSEAAKAALPVFQSHMKQVQLEHERDIAKAAAQSKEQLKEATELAKRKIDEATQQTIAQVSRTTTWNVTGHLKSALDSVESVGVPAAPGTPTGLNVSVTTTDLATLSLSRPTKNSDCPKEQHEAWPASLEELVARSNCLDPLLYPTEPGIAPNKPVLIPQAR